MPPFGMHQRHVRLQEQWDWVLFGKVAIPYGGSFEPGVSVPSFLAADPKNGRLGVGVPNGPSLRPC